MNELHVITTEWVDAPKFIGYRDYMAGTYNAYHCSCAVPLPDREAATLHAAEQGRCVTCLGSGMISVAPFHSDGCHHCDGSGKNQQGAVVVQAQVTEDFVKEVAGLLPTEFRVQDVVEVLRQHMPPHCGSMETVFSVAAGLIRYLKVQGLVVLGTAPDFVPGEGVEQRYGDPMWIRTP
ncbi:hypothetical protein AB0K18_20540 [Nonomuraea sp. NPDC049421]|uniref:hypothetical protein n=1 Tax=Nonomuraea sp. NPDC049421 TaxID=3155275 RepID=UPI00343E79E9